MSNIEEILINFNQEAENIIKNNCFTSQQQEALLDLSKQVYYCLEALNNKNS